MKDITEKKVPENATPVISGQGICPYCDAALPVEEEGRVWCWRCGVPYYAIRQDVQIWLCRVNGVQEATDLRDVDGEEVLDIIDESIDLDEGLHGHCPCCGERLFSWFAGRCRCEICEGLFMIHRRRNQYHWIIDHELLKTCGGRVRVAWRDD